jgi:hypothetical protein
MRLMEQESSDASRFLPFYKYLLVLSVEQITKFRNMAIGVKTNATFSSEEIDMLEQKLSEKY